MLSSGKKIAQLGATGVGVVRNAPGLTRETGYDPE